MIANTAFLAAITVFLIAGWLATELSFLAPYKATLFQRHGLLMAVVCLITFFNLCGLYYNVARLLFLRDSGSKLLHLDRQLGTADASLRDLDVRSER